MKASCRPAKKTHLITVTIKVEGPHLKKAALNELGRRLEQGATEIGKVIVNALTGNLRTARTITEVDPGGSEKP